MGLDDLVNKAKGLLGQGEQKAQDAAGAAAAGDTRPQPPMRVLRPG